MRLYQKLVLFMLVAAVGPVSAVGFALLGHAEEALRERIGVEQAAVAASAAEAVARDVDEAVESLTRAAGAIRWGELSQAERAGALRLVLSQSRHFRAALLVDPAGVPLAPPEAPAGLVLDPLVAALPLAELRSAGAGAVALSGAFFRPEAASAALATRPTTEPVLVAVELSLQAVQERVAQSHGRLWVYDAEERAVAAPPGEGRGALAPEPLRARWRAGGSLSFTLPGAAGASLASVATAPGGLGWRTVVQVPEAEALAPVRRMRLAVLGSVGAALVLLLGLGLAFTRALGRRIGQLTEGADAFGRGELSRRIPEAGADELTELARTFNRMGGELEASRVELQRWNRELQTRVEERTAELKAAQAQLLEAQKLAAIGQLGAGVAHEINNPLAGILGNAQLLLLDRPADDRDAAMLRKIEAQAKRAKEITANLLRFSQQRPVADLRPLDLNKVVGEALSLVQTQIDTESIQLVQELEPGLPPVKGDGGHLAQVVLNLVSNARTAMAKSPEKRLTLATSSAGGRVRLAVRDTGKGIPAANLSRVFEPFFTTKDVWSNVGLGLSVSFRIVSEHGGRIEVASEEGKGTTFTVDLPAA